MSEDHPSPAAGGRTWLERIGQALIGEPRNRAELIAELRTAKDNGLLDADTLKMVEGAISVSDKQVADVMVPRARMVTIPIDASFEAVLRVVVESGHSRFPVHGDSEDQIIGVLLAKDLLKCIVAGTTDTCLKSVVRPVSLIPESKRLNVLLKEFKANRHHMAVVVDEYGGVAGLVTIEDVLEEIVGEIDDEYDAEDRPEVQIHPLADGSHLVQALTPIASFNEYFGTRFADDDCDTIGGLVTHALGHLPEVGECAELGGLKFEVAKADGRRLHALRVRPVDR